MLQQFHAKATFFCLGKQIELFPKTFATTIQNGHSVGSHSFAHPNGWKTPPKTYVRDVLKGAEKVPGNLFRPPYGRITRTQSTMLKKQFRIVMWSLLSGDFDESNSANNCANAVIKHSRPGSIIVFHDSEKAAPRMLPALNKVLQELTNKGYTFSAIQ
jgi:peptidoglycan/xylan/chitin deacetylase (PgdA/CDA1 family)